VYILKELGDKLLALGGRFHWGLNFSQCIDTTPLANMYPKFDAFQTQLKKANALGTYNNRYTKDLGLSVDAGGKRRAGHAHVGDEADAHRESDSTARSVLDDATAPLLTMQVN
jgi:hypothetical protein